MSKDLINATGILTRPFDKIRIQDLVPVGFPIKEEFFENLLIHFFKSRLNLFLASKI